MLELREIFVSANLPRGLTRKTTIWGSHGQALKEWDAFADGDLLLKPEIRFSGLIIAKVHLNYEKFSSFLIFIFFLS